MPTYRSQVRIIVDVLSSANHSSGEEEGVGVTHILRRANLSYSRLSSILNKLIDKGLLNEISQGKIQRYRISDKGIRFLRAYGEFQEFSESFGLSM